jgi:hypothetical protein
MMGAIKREHDWRNLFLTSGGSANAYTLTYSVAPAAYYTGQTFTFTANFGCTGSATLNVNGLGAKTIKKDVSGTMTALSSGDIASGAKVKVSYDGTDFIWINWQGTTGTSYTVNGQTELTSVDTADMIGGYDTSETAERKFSVNNLFKSVNTFTAETAVAVDDVLPLYDTSATAADKATVQNVLKAINGLTEDTSPDTSADFVLTYDTSATDVKKVKPSNLGTSITIIDKAADESVQSSSMQDDNDFLFSVAANTNYEAHLFLNIDRASGTTDGFKCEFTGPASPTRVSYFIIADSTSSGINAAAEAFGGDVACGLRQSQQTAAHVVFRLKNGANAGTVNFRWSGTSNSDTITIQSSSYMTYRVTG